jgi:GAF domain-containing protein
MSDAKLASLNEVTVLYDQRDLQLKKDHRTPRCSGFLNVSLIDELNQGNTVVINDVVTDPRTKDFADQFRELNIGSKILAPRTQAERLTFLFALHKAEPYVWQSREVKLVREVATRVYLRVDRAIPCH